ncbi:MAG: D-alanyl-lipoteichoic acid biosynthesis protein DltD [Anaerostipes sp.]|nr:D-alanyl-lipoteichoic acid biosynthesis protein DltD [Anaerostipes sp.]
MRNIKAFLIALVLSIISAVGILNYVSDTLPKYSIDYGTWMDESKYACVKGITEVLSEDQTIPIFGSSELRHGMNSKYHAKAVFRNTDMRPFLIGQAGYQSLTHTMTMGAVGNSIKEKKAVLIVSPQWFKIGGVKKTAFGASFSEDAFIEFLKNDNISADNKNEMIQRVRQLTKSNKEMNRKINHDVAWYYKGQEGLVTTPRKEVHNFLVVGKSRSKLILRKKVLLEKDNKEAKETKETIGTVEEPDWNKLKEKAEKRGKIVSRNNGFGMYDSIYEKSYHQYVEGKKKLKKVNYDYNSVEFKDLELFIKICKDLNVEPMVVILPYNGRWYDYMGLKKEERKAYYKKVNTLLDKYKVKRSDLSNKEYASYYFRDNSHLLLKGLVDLNEHIYNFYEFDQ